MADITIYLIRDEIKDAPSALTKNLKGHEIKEGNEVLGTLFVGPSTSGPPKWGKFFAPQYVKKDIFGLVQSAGAVYITKAKQRLFAVTFGQGRHLIDPTAIEERFGLLVVLNSIQNNELRSVDKRSFDTVDQNSRVQTSQKSAPAEFGIDIEKDLVRGITGTPTDGSALGRRLTGSDALTVAVKTSPKDLPGLLERYLDRFEAKDYRKTFQWIDNIRQVGERRDLRQKLDANLIEAVDDARKTGKAKGCWLALPDVIDWRRVCRFRFSQDSRDPTHSDIHLPGFFGSFDAAEPITLDLLKKRRVFAIDDENNPLDRWSIYECIHYEVDFDGKSFIFSGGHWFEVAKKFVQQVNQYFEKTVKRYAGAFMEYQHGKEGDYNKALCASDTKRFALMDMKNIQVGGVHDKVEFCDIYTEGKELIHIKRYGGSSLLGHLFNQGLVSGELLVEEETYVAKVNAYLDKAFHLDDVPTPRPVDSYTIVFAIISESKDPLNIPFFARVALRHAHKRLSTLGYDVQLAKIQVNEKFSRDEKLVKKKKKAKAAKP